MPPCQFWSGRLECASGHSVSRVPTRSFANQRRKLISKASYSSSIKKSTHFRSWKEARVRLKLPAPGYSLVERQSSRSSNGELALVEVVRHQRRDGDDRAGHFQLAHVVAGQDRDHERGHRHEVKGGLERDFQSWAG